MAERLKIVKDDPWLEPVEGELEYRRKLYLDALKEIEEASESIADYADGYLYFGFQRDEEAHGWWFREWLPGAWEVFLFGDFNGWSGAACRWPGEPTVCGVFSFMTAIGAGA